MLLLLFFLLVAFLTLAGKAQEKNVQAKMKYLVSSGILKKITEGLLALAFLLCLLLVLVLFPKKCIIYLLSYFTRNTQKKLESY